MMRSRVRFSAVLALLVALFCTTFELSAQGGFGRITARVVDAESAQLPVAGAMVTVYGSGGDALSYYSTDAAGRLLVELAYGKYEVGVAFLGYEELRVAVNLNSASKDLGELKMVASSIQMESVVKEIKAIRSSQKGDTLSYSASAFKVATDSDVEGLLEKMPGISIEDGTISAQGEEITRIYVDGREFFGNDVAMALKSLPAEIVANIEVYDRLSDAAELSGIDDGNSEKTINIVTHKHMRKGVFGKIFGGGGYDDSPVNDASNYKYTGGMSLNSFIDKSRISVIAMTNNLNQQNFAFEDIMGATDNDNSSTSTFMVRQLPGIANVNAVGVNYSDVYGKREQVKMQASLFFNKTITTNEEILERWYEGVATDTDDSLHQRTYSVIENINTRFNSRIEWKPSERQTLVLRPSLSMQTYLPHTEVSGTRYGQGYVVDDEEYGVQSYSNNVKRFREGINLAIDANYSLRLGKPGRVISVGAGYTHNQSQHRWGKTTEPNDPNVNDSETTYFFESRPSTRKTLNASANYSEPLGKLFALTLNYKGSQFTQLNPVTSYSTDDDTYQASDSLTEDDVLSSETFSRYITHSVGPGLRFVKDKTSITAGLSYQLAEQNSYTIDSSGEYTPCGFSYQNLIYSVIAQVYINPSNSLRTNISSSTTSPSVWRLQDAYSIGDGDYITKGNPLLEQSYSQSIRFRYINSNLTKGSTFMITLFGQKQDNYVATHLIYNPEPFYIAGELYEDVIQYTTYANLDNYWKFRSNISYGFPLDFMKCNMNLSAGITYDIIPTIYGGLIQDDGTVVSGVGSSGAMQEVLQYNVNEMTYRAGVTLGSNISENVDFTLKWNGYYTEATNSVTADSTVPTKNIYYRQTASATMKFVFGGGFTFTGSAAYNQYRGITDTYNVNYLVCNAFLGRKVFKGDRGEIIVGVNDMLNQNRSFTRTVGNSYSQNVTNSAIGRYFSAQLIYNLRYFGKGASTNFADYQSQPASSDGPRGPRPD
ncbi:MAG: TonB-dependent receptor [Rikenellaceae bacterium]